jgi:hypothetical protein
MEGIEENFVEPQAQEAVKVLEGKGYKVGTLAGSSGNPAEGKQAIVFNFPKWEAGTPVFDEATVGRLRSAGFKQYSGAVPVGTIGFEFAVDTKDAKAMQDKWQELADMLPELKG